MAVIVHIMASDINFNKPNCYSNYVTLLQLLILVMPIILIKVVVLILILVAKVARAQSNIENISNNYTIVSLFRRVSCRFVCRKTSHMQRNLAPSW